MFNVACSSFLLPRVWLKAHLSVSFWSLLHEISYYQTFCHILRLQNVPELLSVNDISLKYFLKWRQHDICEWD